MLADTAQRTVGGQRWWQRFETDVELGGFNLSALAIAGWTIVGGIVASIAGAISSRPSGACSSVSSHRSSRAASSRVGSRRCAGHSRSSSRTTSTCSQARCAPATRRWAPLSVMVDSAIEPSKSEFRRVLQDEQLGVPLDDALMVMARRMQSYDAEQIALVMRLQREAGGNTAEVLDRVAEVIRGRMELRRLVDVLTAQARISRWILTGLPDLRARRAHLHGRRLSPADARLARRQDRARRRRRSWC